MCPTTIAPYRIQGGVVNLFVSSQLSGTSSSGTFQLNGLPAEIIPATVHAGLPVVIVDNGVQSTTPGYAQVNNDGTISLGKDWTGASFTASGTKALGSGITFTYNLL